MCLCVCVCVCVRVPVCHTGELPAIPQLRVRCEAALAAKRRELETQQDQLSQQQMAESSAKAQVCSGGVVHSALLAQKERARYTTEASKTSYTALLPVVLRVLHVKTAHSYQILSAHPCEFTLAMQ